MTYDESVVYGMPGATESNGGTVESIDFLAAHQSGDHILAMYIAAFNETPGTGMKATVFTDGYAFSGRIVGNADYFDRVADLADDDAITVPFRTMAEEYRSDPDDGTTLITTYIHMLDVKVFAGAKRVAKLKTWRGRLSQISGWTTEVINPK
jgi:hypothetical protein